MRSNGKKPEQRVEVETRQAGGMASHSQLPLGQKGLCGKRGDQDNGHDHPNENAERGLKPGDRTGCKAQLKDCPQQLAYLIGQVTQSLGRVASFCHVRCQTALKIAIAELRNLFEKSNTEPVFYVSPEPSANCEGGEFEKKQGQAEEHHAGNCPHTLSGQPQFIGHVKQASKEHDFDDGPPGRNQ